jgi:hypothetical protein
VFWVLKHGETRSIERMPGSAVERPSTAGAR